MRILHGLDALGEIPPGAVVSIGNFDGIHLGHRRIFRTGRELVEKGLGSWLVVITFEPHPLTVLRPHLAPPRLTLPEAKREILELLGVDVMVVLPPAPEVLSVTAERFWELLRDVVRPSHLVEGGMFRFGKGAAGTVKLLMEWAKGSGVQVMVVESVAMPMMDMQVVRVSSSAIRLLLEFGRVRDAAIGLGRPYRLGGVVEKGFGRGRELGVPTANLKVDDQLVPGDGVYAGRCEVGGRKYAVALSIGTMPTFGQRNPRQIEGHLIGFEGDLYGRRLEIDLLDYLRDQYRFTGVEPLKAQMARDLAETVSRESLDPSRPIATDGVQGDLMCAG